MGWQDKVVEKFPKNTTKRQGPVRKLDESRKEVIQASALVFAVTTVFAGFFFQKNYSFIGIAFSIISFVCVIFASMAYFHFPEEKNHEAR